MKRPYLTVLQYSTLSYLVIGIGLFVFSILDFFSGLFVNVLTLLSGVVIIASFAIRIFVKREGMDEMAKVHMNDAYGDGFLAMMVAMLVLETLDHFGIAEIALTTATCICFGAGFTAIGLRFRKLEKYGEDE